MKTLLPDTSMALREPHSGPVSGVLLRASHVLGFFSVVLLCLNAFPYGPVSWLYPERPAYLVGLAGMLCYLTSLRWLSQIRRHRMLLLIVGLIIAHGFAVSIAGALRISPDVGPDVGPGGGLVGFTLFNFWFRKAIPTLYVLWFAFMLSAMDGEKRRRFFLGALVVMFLLNAAHMVLENLANFGLQGIKDWLVSVNPLFRKVASSHGGWPPSYYIDRVRGLFAEPSHLAYALIPLLGFFFCKLERKALYILPIAFIAFSFTLKIPTATGLISLGLFLAFFLYRKLRSCPAKTRLAACALLAVAVSAALFACREDIAGQYRRYAREWKLAGEIVTYARLSEEGLQPAPPNVEGPRSRFFTRMACLRMEADIAFRHPLGTGFYLSGFSWAPLQRWSSSPLELFVYVREAFTRPVPVIPHLCEYSALASELGFIGLALFLWLCLYSGSRVYRANKEKKEAFLSYALFSLLVFMASLFSFALKSGFLLYFFLGFLYSLVIDSQNNHMTCSRGEKPI